MTFHGGHVDNDGTIVSNDGDITFCGTSVDNCGGSIQTDGPDASVNLVGATIVGGTIETEDDSVFEAVSGVNIFRNVTLEMSSNDGSTIKVDFGATLKLQGTTTIDGSTSLVGGGVVALDCASDEVTGSLSGGTLINQTTIEGVGTLSNLTLINNASGVSTAIFRPARSSSTLAIPSPTPACSKRPAAASWRSTISSTITAPLPG